jgi:hypothetical protein
MPEVRGLLREGGRLVLGHARRDKVSVGLPWKEFRVLEHGDSVFRMLGMVGAEVAPSPETSAEPEASSGTVDG